MGANGALSAGVTYIQTHESGVVPHHLPISVELASV